MELLPEFEKEIKRHQKTGKVEPFLLPKDPDFYAKTINYVYTVTGARDMAALAFQRSVSHIGMAFLYGNGGNPRKIKPFLLSLVMAEPRKNGRKVRLYRFVVDLRKTKVIPVIKRIFGLPVCFVGYDLKYDLFALWKLGIVPPKTLWDTLISEQAFDLGRFAKKYHVRKSLDLPQQIKREQAIKEKKAFHHDFNSICQRYGIPCGGNRLETLRKALSKQKKWQPLAPKELIVAGEKASNIAQLYFEQVQKATTRGVLCHLVPIEMPFVRTNAEIQWTGALIDPEIQKKYRRRARKLLKKFKKAFAEYGLSLPLNDEKLRSFFKEAGILGEFRVNGAISFEKEILKENKAKHPVIPLILAFNKVQNVGNDKILKGDYQDTENCIYPVYKQLGADTGRLTSQNPDLMGLNAILRPLIVPEGGYLIGEADWSQMEIGILAALYRDEALIAMYNTGDVYSEMAKVFYKSEIDPDDLRLKGPEFKQKYPENRKTMKTCILAVIYGMTPESLAKDLKCSVREARQLHEKVIAMVSEFDSIQTVVQWSGIRGYASNVTNLQRQRATRGKIENWEQRWLLNHTIQGTGAAIFKITANRLMELYRPLGARIVVPLHDSFVFQAPKDNFKQVTRLTKRIMKEVFQEFFPVLKPRVEVNVSKPHCWNKAGKTNQLSRWVKKQKELLKAHR